MSAEGVPVVRVVCDLCDGTGTITIVEDYDFEGKSIYAPDECPECEGRLYVERTLYVDAAHPAAASAEREAQPTRGDVGRPESTRDPVFLLRWRPKKCDPGRDRWHVEGVWFTREEAEQFAKAHAYRWGSDQFGPCWHVYCVPAEGEMARLLKTVTKRDAALAAARATKEVS